MVEAAVAEQVVAFEDDELMGDGAASKALQPLLGADHLNSNCL